MEIDIRIDVRTSLNDPSAIMTLTLVCDPNTAKRRYESIYEDVVQLPRHDGFQAKEYWVLAAMDILKVRLQKEVIDGKYTTIADLMLNADERK